MKPLQIGLLVLVGALGGALIMKFTQRPKPAPAPVASVAPAAAPVAAPAAVAEVKPPAVAEVTPPAPVAPAPENAGQARRPVPRPDAVVMTHHSHPMIRALPVGSPATVAQTMPPAQPATPAPVPGLPVPEPSAPPIAAEPAPEPAPTPAPVEPAAPQPAPSVTLQTGLTMPVRLGESLSSEHNQAGDTFTATLDAPLAAGGFVIAEKGARVEGRVVEAQKSAHAKGKATLALELTKLITSDGQHVEIKTETLRKQSEHGYRRPSGNCGSGGGHRRHHRGDGRRR